VGENPKLYRFCILAGWFDSGTVFDYGMGDSAGGKTMDDDLMSLRGSASGDKDDLFGDFSPSSAPPPEPMKASSAAPIGGGLDLDLGGPSTPSAAAKPKPSVKKSSPRKKVARKRSSGGMTPQQRMLLSVFLFLDVAVLGCLVLIAVGAINI
jgi:hypothetical protein